jgi:hypothetical protein
MIVTKTKGFGEKNTGFHALSCQTGSPIMDAGHGHSEPD